MAHTRKPINLKKFRQKATLAENALAGDTLPGPMNPDGAIDDGSSLVTNFENDSDLSKINAYVGSLCKRNYVNPDVVVRMLQSNLLKVGIWFEYRGEFNAGLAYSCQKLYFPIVRNGGRNGVLDNNYNVGSSRAFSDGANYEIGIALCRQEDNSYSVTAEICRVGDSQPITPADKSRSNILGNKLIPDGPYQEPLDSEEGLLSEEIDYDTEGKWCVATATGDAQTSRYKKFKVGEQVYLKRSGRRSEIGPDGFKVPGKSEPLLLIWKPPYYADVIELGDAKKIFKIDRVVPTSQQDDMDRRYAWELHR